ncbi:MAG: glycosyltransferase family 2 protein [Prevotellaceae bacterium]|jgi:GT2 family glycosyltransferase|nr:glycosyltransferase family 2 protein [Prevotellaceae bacterium]
MDKIAVIILNWNGLAMLQRFLPSVVEHSTEKSVVYVADNGSTDDSLKWIRENCPTVRILELSRNYGFAAGYNNALHRVEAEYAVLLNSDVEVTAGWLDPLIRYMDEHPETAACQPKIRSWQSREYYRGELSNVSTKKKKYPRKKMKYLTSEMFEYAGAAGGFLDRYGYPYCRGRIMQCTEADTGQYDTIMPVFWATGAAMCVRMQAYWEAGGLDWRFFAHMEEIDLCWRLQLLNYRIVCVPESVVYHVGAATLRRESPQKTFLNFRNNRLMLFKNLPDAEWRRVKRVRDRLDLLASLTFLLKGRWSNARAVWRAMREAKQLYPRYAEHREIWKSRMHNSVIGCMPFCLVIQYYVLGKRRFDRLPIK